MDTAKSSIATALLGDSSRREGLTAPVMYGAYLVRLLSEGVMNKKILVVEDEPNLLHLESLLLTSRGYHVRSVSDGESALESLSMEKPDLVLLDILLPSMDGFEVCQRIKSNPSTQNVLVAFLSAKKSKKDLVRGQQVGADHYFHKPFRSAELIRDIDSLLSRNVQSPFL